MRLLHSRNSWYYSQGGNPAVDFCLWVLQRDGLCVPPFDQHTDGDGALRALGLTEEDWQAWFLRTLDPVQHKHDVEQLRQLHLAEYLKISGEPDLEHLEQRYQAGQLKGATGPALPPPPEFYPYQASWKGSSALKNELIALEKLYGEIEQEQERWRKDAERSLQREEARAATRLYDDLKPYHHRLPPLNIYLTAYASPLDYLVAPATLLITIQEGQPGLQEFRERVLAAVAELASQAGRRRGSSVYTRKGDNAGHSIAYRKHERKSTTLLPRKRPEMPRLDDPFRQMIVEKLWDERFYEPVDPATLCFLREKQRPGWRLHEVSFQELDGEQQRMIFVLEQDDDGSWRQQSGGTSSDMQKQWSEIVAPVRDHPLLFLGTLGYILGKQQYLQIAHGDVIDNGFQVARVRLINDAGQVFEDVVEDGYVFFACKLKEQVQMPLQAELYDRQGKLVWRQKVPDEGVPQVWARSKKFFLLLCQYNRSM